MRGRRAKALAAAGVVLHGHARAPGRFMRAGIAECGARGSQGAEFTTWGKYVSCPVCRAIMMRRRAAAKARLAQIEGGACRS